MDGKKAAKILAVAVVLIAVLGVVAGIVASSPTVIGTGKDVVSNDLGKGDYYEINMTSTASTTGNEYMSKSEYYGWLYDISGEWDPLHPKEITVNGKTVECRTYFTEYTEDDVDYTKLVFVDYDKSRSYGYELYIGPFKDGNMIDCRYLVGTSFSLDTEYSDLEMTLNNKITYTTTTSATATVCPAVSLTMDSKITQTIGSFDSSKTKWTIAVEQNTSGSQNAKAVVEDFIKNADGEYVKTSDGNILEKYAYLMTIDYLQFLEYIGHSGATPSHGLSSTKTIDTVYGSRCVTEHNVTVFGDINADYVIQYGDNNVIYSIKEMKHGQSGAVTITLKSSNLVSEATTEVYSDPLTLTVNSFTVGTVIMVIMVLAALIGGYAIFKYIKQKDEPRSR